MMVRASFGWRFGMKLADLDGRADVVAAAVLHPAGTVLATCSGQRRPMAGGVGGSEDGEESGDEGASSAVSAPSETVFPGDNSLKVWAL